jgi:hypothetical protein
MDEIKINVTFKEADFNNFIIVLSRPNCKKQSLIMFMAALIASIATAFSGTYLNSLGFYQDLFGIIYIVDDALIFLLIFSLTLSFLVRYNPTQHISPEGSFLRPKEYRINEKGIQETNSLHTSTTSWEAILKIEEDENLILFYVDTCSAYVIPRHSFDTTIEADAFVRKAKDFHQAALRNADKKPSFIPRTPTNTRWDE